MSAAYFVALALQHHQAGNLGQAEELYRQALQADPHNADAHHLLGAIACQTGRYEQAVVSIRQALALNPGAAPYYANLGLALVALDQLDEAVECYRQALRLSPHDAEVHYKIGAALHRQNRLREAIAHYQEALRLQPAYAEAHNNLGQALAGQGQRNEAIAHYQQALRLQPAYAEAHNNLGMALGAQGKLEEAEACYRQALRCNPNFAEALNNLGTALADQGRLDEAVENLQHVVGLRPQDAVAHYNLASALHRQEKLDEAVAHFQQALILRPDYAQAHNNLGNVLADQGKLDEAVTHYQWALQLKPDYTDAHINLGITLADQGKLDEALASCQRTVDLEVGQPTKKVRVLLATLLPPIYQSMQEVLDWRQHLTDNLKALHEEHFSIDLTTETASPCFHLAYQGFNDRDLQRQLASLYTAPAESLGHSGNKGVRPHLPERPEGCFAQMGPDPFVANSAAKVRVGFISRLFKEHTIGRLMGGMIAQLSRDMFNVTVLSLGSHKDAVARRIQQHANSYLEVPSHLPSARRLIAGQQLDVLFYTDIGMDRVTYSLAFSRLAPVQCVTWGHPVTTGIPTMDYFISSKLLESAQCDQHYTEQLVKLKSLASYYYRPKPPARLEGRANFGLPDAGSLYACPQALFKFHPEFDQVLGAILRRDPRGTLVLIQGRYRHWQELLLQRFATTMPDVVERIRFVPPQDHEHFLNLNALADVLLDPLHFGGGNTSYEGLALGVPIVTMATPFLRGRFTAALYKQMGVMDCVVASMSEYVDLAVKLGTDADYRAAIRAKIMAANDALFENSAGIRELELFFQEAVRRARAGLLPMSCP